MNLVFSIEGSYILTFREVCNFLGSVSSEQKFEATDRPVLQLTVTAQFYLAGKGKHILVSWGWAEPKDVERRARLNLVPLFICFFLFPLNLPYVNWASQEGCLLHLRFSLRSSDLPLFYFRGLFPSLYFSHCQSGLLFPILTT